MKKLTLKALKEIMEETSYFLGGYKGILKDKNVFFIIYPFTMVKLIYSPSSQWSIMIYGECLHMLAKYSLRLCDKLEERCYIGELNDD